MTRTTLDPVARANVGLEDLLDSRVDGDEAIDAVASVNAAATGRGAWTDIGMPTVGDPYGIKCAKPNRPPRRWFCRGTGRHLQGDADMAKGRRRGPVPVPPYERLMLRVSKQDGGCWLWTGPPTPNGYAHVSLKGIPQYGHRVAYEYHVGPIPEDCVIHHACGTKLCVNPAHLELMTHSDHEVHHNPATALCQICGQANWYYRPSDGRRSCRMCEARRARSRYQRRMEKEVLL